MSFSRTLCSNLTYRAIICVFLCRREIKKISKKYFELGQLEMGRFCILSLWREFCPCGRKERGPRAPCISGYCAVGLLASWRRGSCRHCGYGAPRAPESAQSRADRNPFCPLWPVQPTGSPGLSQGSLWLPVICSGRACGLEKRMDHARRMF